MIKYEIGTRFPHEKYLNRGEMTVAMLNEKFFDVTCVLGFISAEEKKDFRKGNLTVHLYEQGNVPYICFAFENWNFDVNINITKVEEEHVDDWLNSDGNTITLFLVDAGTGNLEAMRLISIPAKMAERIRDICEKQTEMNPQQIELNIQSALAGVPTMLMITSSDMKFKIK